MTVPLPAEHAGAIVNYASACVIHSAYVLPRIFAFIKKCFHLTTLLIL